MAKELKDLTLYITEGEEIYNDPNNRMYLRSSFKRIIKGWKSDIEKIEKLNDDLSALKKELKNVDEKLNNEKDEVKKSKYSKEKEKLEKECDKLEKKIEQLVSKLNQKMKKEAAEYLANKKTFADKTGLSVAKNPKKLTKIQEYQKHISEIWGYYSKIYNLVEKEVSPMVERAYSYYFNELLPEYTKSSIDSVVTKLKELSITTKTKMEKLLKNEKLSSTYKDPANNICTDPDLFEFVLCYINQESCKERFSKWIETERYYLKNFKDLTEDEMLKYHKHGAYIDKTTELKADSEQLIAASKKFYSFCEDLKKTTDLKYKTNIIKGYFYVTTALILPIELTLIGGAILQKNGLNLLNDKKKSLYQNLSNLVNKNNNDINELVDQRPGKNDLNVRKVEYMRKVSAKLG